MSTNVEQSVAATIGRQALKPLSWTVPRLKAIYENGARDMKPRTQDELNALIGKVIGGTAMRHLVESGVADGLLVMAEERNARTYTFTEMARLIFMASEDAAAKAMPLFAERHGEIYGLNYVNEWERRSVALLAQVYEANHVPEWTLRAAAFPSEKAAADAARAGDNERFRKLFTYPPFEPKKYGPRTQKSEDDDASEETGEDEPQSATVTGTQVARVVPPAPSQSVNLPQGVTFNFYFGVTKPEGS